MSGPPTAMTGRLSSLGLWTRACQCGPSMHPRLLTMRNLCSVRECPKSSHSREPRVEVAQPFLTELWMSHSVTSAMFYWLKHSQAHPDLRGGDTDPTSQWETYRRIWSHVLKYTQHSIMLWQYVCFLCLCVQSCPTLGNPTDCSPPGSSVRRISQQEYWSGLPFPSLEDLPDPGIKPVSSALAGRFFTTEPPGQPCCSMYTVS